MCPARPVSVTVTRAHPAFRYMVTSMIKWIKEILARKKRLKKQPRLEYCIGPMGISSDDLTPIEGDDYEVFLSDIKRKAAALPPEPGHLSRDIRMPDGQVIRGYTLPNIFAWREVVESLENRIREAYWVKDGSCEECGGQGVAVICFRSSKESWKSLCGREGYMLICTDCVKKLRFKEYIMN